MSDRVEALRTTSPESWVALSEDESHVVGRGSTFEEAATDAEKNGVSDPILILVPPDWTDRVLWVILDKMRAL